MGDSTGGGAATSRKFDDLLAAFFGSSLLADANVASLDRTLDAGRSSGGNAPLQVFVAEVVGLRTGAEPDM